MRRDRLRTRGRRTARRARARLRVGCGARGGGGTGGGWGGGRFRPESDDEQEPNDSGDQRAIKLMADLMNLHNAAAEPVAPRFTLTDADREVLTQMIARAQRQESEPNDQ